jgi:hypothetical protein
MNTHYTKWRKSSHSDPNGDCIEAGRASDGTVGVRDTQQHGRGPILQLSQSEWAAFLGSLRHLPDKG